ncbi:MAG TPA: hypothetical protein PLL76_22635, partial [Thermoanaerobaculia bacterium]|nr:hypothetical protein [Thermoanaerobaculia bacterium]
MSTTGQHTVEIDLKAKDSATSTIRGVVSGIQSQLGYLMGPITAMTGAVGLGALVKKGVEFNKTMEDSKGGIAGVLLMTREYVDATGKVVTGQKAMDAAFAESSVIQEKLKEDALGTAASYTELVQAFQSSVGPATKAGIKDLDDVREITVMATQAMAALGIPTAQAAQELRGLFAGDMGPDNRLNQVLGVTKADLNAVAGDADAVTKLFKDRLAPAASVAASRTETLTVRMSNLGDTIDQAMGGATTGIFSEISDLVAEVTKGVEANKGIFEDLGETVRVAFGVVKDIFSDVFGTANDTLKSHGLTWRDFLFMASTLFVGFVESVGSGVKFIVQYLTAPIETIRGLWKTLIGGLASLLGEFLRGIADTPVIGKLFAGAAESLDRFVVSLTTGDEAFDRFQKKAERNWGEGAFAAARKMMEDYGKETKKTTDELDTLGTRVNTTGAGAAAAAIHFGQVWATESAKASAALEKFLGEFAGFTGDTVGEATAKIEKEYQGLVGQLGQLMFQAKVPFEKGLAMLEDLASAKGEQIVAAVFNGEAAVEEFIGVLERKRGVWQKAIEDIFRGSPDDTKEGAKAGLFGVFAALPSAAESAATAVQEIWGSMARTFDDVFFSALTGKLDSLKDVFKSLWESILQTASRYFSDLLQRWLATQMQMGQPAPGSYPGVGAAGSAGKSGWGSAGAYLGAGVAGFGIGGMIGQGGAGNQWGGALGAVGGLALGSTATAVGLGVSAGMTGAMAGSVVPIIGTIVGAIIGAIIGGIFNKNTEKKFSVYTARLVDVAANDQIGRSIQNSRDNIIGMMGDLAALTGGSVKDATDQTRKVINDWLKGRRYEVHAGSQEDIDKDFERLLGEVVPSEMLKQLFGFSIKPYEPTTELPGIRGVGNFHMGNIDEGKEGPLFKMLETLGFARDRIVEIGQQIDARPAEEFIQWLNRL